MPQSHMDITTTASKPSPEGSHPTKPIFFKCHAPPGGGAYKECLKNHAATMGGHALDGCGEFFPESTADPTSLTCGACGCHRNFHRRDPDSAPVIEYRPHHRHHPPPPSTMARGSHSPPPISSSYYPHMLLSLDRTGPGTPNRKRLRTKFTPEQKEKMLELGEKLGWKMQKINDDLVEKFCSEIGVERRVFKVWMHNNKNTLAKSDTGNGNNNFQRESHCAGNGNGNSHSSSIEHQDHNGKSNGASANNASSS